MTKESLSDKMFETLNETGKNVIWIEDVKEKIQNVQRRLKELIKAPIKTAEVRTVEDLLEEIDKIFLEEFGEKLIK